MVQINWGLATGPNAFDNALAQGYQMGTAMRQRQQESERKNALAAYATDPNEQNFAGLAQAAPEIAIGERQRIDAARAEQQTNQLTQDALNGVPGAMDKLATASFDRWKTLDSRAKEETANKAKILGGAAIDVLGVPDPAQRMVKLQGYIQNLAPQFPGIEQLLQLPPDQIEAKLRTVVAEAQLTEKLIAMERPDYMVVPEGGSMVNQRDPKAVAAFGQIQPPQGGGQPVQITGEADYNALPPGAQYIDPNGNLRTKGGGVGNGTGGF